MSLKFNIRQIVRISFVGSKNEFLRPKVDVMSFHRTVTCGCGCECDGGKKSKNDEDELVTPMQEAVRFMMDCLMAVGTPKKNAEIAACNLVQADYRGHYSHGMNRLEMYVKDIKTKTCDPCAEPTIVKENSGTALVDGNNGLGAVIGLECMNIALDKAKDSGIAFVACKGSNHYGIAGIYGLQALERGFIGFSMTNTSPFLVPTRAKDATLGTNPIMVAAPALDGDSFVLDMATTAVAVGKIEIQRRKGQPIPHGWAMNADGKVETNAEVAYKAGRLMPLGGTEENSGYKGSGLGLWVEIFCGILAGATYGANIRKWGTNEEIADLGQCFMAINPKCFAEDFECRLSDILNYIRNMPPVDPNLPVLVAGDKERIHMAKVKKDGGLRYVKNQHDTNEKLADELKVKPMVSKKG